jgi:hypothetical protein
MRAEPCSRPATRIGFTTSVSAHARVSRLLSLNVLPQQTKASGCCPMSKQQRIILTASSVCLYECEPTARRCWQHRLRDGVRRWRRTVGAGWFGIPDFRLQLWSDKPLMNADRTLIQEQHRTP